MSSVYNAVWKIQGLHLLQTKSHAVCFQRPWDSCWAHNCMHLLLWASNTHFHVDLKGTAYSFVDDSSYSQLGISYNGPNSWKKNQILNFYTIIHFFTVHSYAQYVPIAHILAREVSLNILFMFKPSHTNSWGCKKMCMVAEYNTFI